MADPTVLEVLLHRREIGTLTRLGGDRILFAFNDAYIKDPARPTLSLSFRDAYGELIVDVKATQSRAPPFFANLLPEGRLREYLAARAEVNDRRDFPLLQVLGADLPGAVEIRPAGDDSSAPASERHVKVRGDEAGTGAFRFSLAGVQLKFSAVNDARGGLTIPARGVGGDWIIKLPSTTFEGIPANEFSMMTLAREVGIEVPEVKLVDLKTIEGLPTDILSMEDQALAVRRFDRAREGRIHIEDFAQVFGLYPERKYERASYRNIAKALWIEIGEEAIVEFMRRLIFAVLTGNADLHLKNWSLIYPDQIAPKLAPAYDLVSTIAYLPEDKLALTFGRSKAWEEVTLDEIRFFAGKAELPETILVDVAKETVQRFLEAWERGREQLPLAPRVVRAIAQHLENLPLAREVSG